MAIVAAGAPRQARSRRGLGRAEGLALGGGDGRDRRDVRSSGPAGRLPPGRRRRVPRRLRELEHQPRTYVRYTRPLAMQVEYREEPCRNALNRVRGMMFGWSLNPYMGCAHRCTFCYVRAFELRADRPFDDHYGRSIRVKTNVVEVLRRELGKPTWQHEAVAIGAATDPYQPAEGRYRLTRGCIEAL